MVCDPFNYAANVLLNHMTRVTHLFSDLNPHLIRDVDTVARPRKYVEVIALGRGPNPLWGDVSDLIGNQALCYRVLAHASLHRGCSRQEDE